jgi:hypothetical protein
VSAFSTAGVMAALPPRVARVMDGFLREPRSSPVELHREVSDYLDRLETKARGGDFLDIVLATEVARLLHRLIDTLQPPVAAERQRLVQGAVRYFVTEQDAESDRDSLIGFEDDRLVAIAVAAELDVDAGELAATAASG